MRRRIGSAQTIQWNLKSIMRFNDSMIPGTDGSEVTREGVRRRDIACVPQMRVRSCSLGPGKYSC